MSEEEPEDTEGRIVSTDATAATRAVVSSDYKVRGKTDAPGGAGVVGHNTAASGVSYGVEGQSDADADSGNGVHPAGVAGRTTGSGVTYGVYGRGDSVDAQGIVGDATKAGQFSFNDQFPTGVSGITDRSSLDDGVDHAHGVAGGAIANSGTAYGVVGQSTTPDGAGVRGWDLDGNGLGVLSSGDSKTTGNHQVDGYVDAGEGYRGSVGASAYVSTEHTVASSSSATVQFDSVDVDDRGEFDAANYEFVTEYAGDYHVNAAVEVYSVPEGERVQLELYEGSFRAAVSKHYGPGSGSKRMTIAISMTLKSVSAGESIRIDLKNRTNVDLTVSDLQRFSHLEVTQVG